MRYWSYAFSHAFSYAFSYAFSCAFSLAFLTIAAVSPGAAQAPKKEPTIINPAPTAQDWADIAKLPDWSGVWNPKITDQDAQAKSNMPPWNPKAAALIAYQLAE